MRMYTTEIIQSKRLNCRVDRGTAIKVAKNLNVIQQTKNLTDVELAKMIGISYSSLYNLKTEYKLTNRILFRIKDWAKELV